MPDTIGSITVPEIAVSSTFPIVADYPFGRCSYSDAAIHQFGSGNAKIEQRFLLGAGAKRFTVRRALRDFWESKYGPYGVITYSAPNDNGNGTTAYICRFANEPLSEMDREGGRGDRRRPGGHASRRPDGRIVAAAIGAVARDSQPLSTGQ